ncbi:hypothetical protein [Pseudodesulfovibrio piezophilus]|uniref:Uncharacterized protein n=1 Tax=Pseudodesulfovibrio piezophilus (strain DSM 21447 / JCM 15486 / C1TLV30) TaxID=1322246 RepID=M1WMB9_PSEP2|nr:hypothetical protein [Pseudodesulfovibrio piezophilus]CCH49335.1 protein of unknown function [Pseudodesulfovibrio piezophilus C1TLV30]
MNTEQERLLGMGRSAMPALCTSASHEPARGAANSPGGSLGLLGLESLNRYAHNVQTMTAALADRAEDIGVFTNRLWVFFYAKHASKPERFLARNVGS